MSKTWIAQLPDRGVVAVTGPDAEKLLQGVLTNDMDLLSPPPGGEGSGVGGAPAGVPAIHAGLLTPQGKILFDFLVSRTADGFLLDVARDQAPALAKRLGMYKLRAKADIADVSAGHVVFAMWGEHPTSMVRADLPDPRLSALGIRFISSLEFARDDASASNGDEATAAAYHARRIALGVPEGGKDFAFADTFPHEALFDKLNGVSFTKGCYVGQEVVSRMEHRGTARKRVVPVVADGSLPASGTEIRAGDQLIGTLGSTDGRRGLALLRLDRAAEMKAAGHALMAGDVPVTIEMPEWLRLDEPADH